MRPAVLTTMILLLGCGTGDRAGQPAAGADGENGFEPPVATNDRPTSVLGARKNSLASPFSQMGSARW